MGWTPYFLKRIKDKNYEFEFSQIASLFLGFLGLAVIIVSLWISEIIEFKIVLVSLIKLNIYIIIV